MDNLKEVSMSIKIETEKVRDPFGNKGFKVTGLKCLQYFKLPEDYLQGKKPVVYSLASENGILLRNTSGDIPNCMYIGVTYRVEDFYKMLEHIKQAGKHLQEVNDGWKDEEVFVI